MVNACHNCVGACVYYTNVFASGLTGRGHEN